MTSDVFLYDLPKGFIKAIVWSFSKLLLASGVPCGVVSANIVTEKLMANSTMLQFTVGCNL